ncbi:MAG: hypothetical protein ROY99_00805 [Ignavibacterium sp.]|jgi:hypothetical protein|nr:hypothetical protein [Ignavibacterium sp.]
MIFRFWYEFVFGIITLLSVLIFGPKGFAAIVPMALLPIIMRIKKIKPDERDNYLFYKSTQYIINAIVILIFVGIFVFRVQLNDIANIDGKLLGIIASVFLIMVSSLRLFMYYKR